MKIETGGVHWNVYEQGSDKPALVFLHYFGGSGRAWSEVMTCLEDEYQCVAPDLRGFGGSSDVPEGYTVMQAAEDTAQLIASLGLENYVLVGHSMGGKIALLLAAQRPQGLRSLILVAPSPPTPEPMTEQERAHLLATHGQAGAAYDILHKITARPLRADLLVQAIDDNLRTSAAAWKWWLEHGSRENISPQVDSVAVPILAIAGAKDPVIPASLVKSLFGESATGQPFPAAEVRVVPEVGHLLPMEAANALSHLIHSFIQGTLSAPN